MARTNDRSLTALLLAAIAVGCYHPVPGHPRDAGPATAGAPESPDAGPSSIWQEQDLGADLHAVWGLSREDVYAVGAGVFHWDGSAWRQESALPTLLEAVWGSGPGDVWAVGGAGGMLHWNGFFWSSLTGVTSLDLHGVWGAGPSDVWVAGGDGADSGAIFHYDGARWTRADPGGFRSLGAIWGSRSDDVWAVGEADIAHWDGARWSLIQSEASSDTLMGIGGTPGGLDVFAVGATHGLPDETPSILRGFACIFSAESAGASLGGLRATWAKATSDVWAVGAGGLVLHRTGAWVPVDTPTHAQLNGVWGLPGDDLWVVGAGGTILTAHVDASAGEPVDGGLPTCGPGQDAGSMGGPG